MDLQIRDLQYDAIPVELARRVIAATAELIGSDVDALSLVFVDDALMQTLNRDFRNSDAPTDVISFEAEREGDQLTGEIIISVPTAQRQAQAAGHSLEAEIAWLLAHGVLHVAGMDDGTQEQLEQMIQLQRRVMGEIGLEPAA